jgi:signal transduction histidine kinase
MDIPVAKPLDHEAAPSGALEKRDLLARLIGRLAHEIRNPLSSLDIHVQLLAEDLGDAPSETRQQLAGRLDIIRGELTRLENIVKRFLRLASPSALELEPVDLERIVTHVCNLLGPEATARQVKIETRTEPGVFVLQADGGQLTQALLNLVINALQAMEGDGRILIRVAGAPSGDAIVLEVQDSGPGIAPDKQTAVFEPYFTTKEEGSGLGLWIAQQIAVAHGGALEASNAPEGGAVFRLRLPIPAQEARSRG